MAQEKTFSVHYDTTATANDPAEETLDYTSFSSSLQPSPITVPSHRKSIANTNNNNLHNSTNTNSNTIKSLSSSSSTVTTASSNSATTTTSISSSHQNYSNIDTDSINTHTTDTTHLSPSSQLVSSETTTEDSTVATNNTTSTTTATNSISQIIPKNRSSSRISAQRQSKILSVSGSGTGGSGDGHNNHSDFLDLNGGKENTVNQSCSSESITTTNTTATNTHTTTSIMKNSDKKKPSSSSKTSDKKKYENYPVKNIKEPHSNDVLYGRGGGTNHHPGNKKYRKMVETRKIDYVNSKRLDKPLVALEIIKEWRSQDPPGRFLKLDEDSGLWQDVGDKKAREKTSQALREKAPMLRKQQEELLEEQRLKDERDTYGGSGVSGHSRSSSFHSGRSSSAPSGASRRGAGGSSTPSSSSRSRKSPHHKTTRFSAGTNTSTSNRPKRVSRVSRGGVNGRGSTGGGTSPSGSGGANHSIAPALLARDHSLGRDWIRADDPLTVHNFSWDTEAVTSGMMGGVMPLDPPDENEEKLVDRNMNSGLNQSFDERMQSAWIQRSPSSGATGTTTSPQYAIRGSGRMSPKTSSYYATSSGGPHDPVSSPIPSQHHERGGGGYHHEDYHPMSPQRLHPHDSSRSASSTPSRPTFYTERGHSLALNPLQNASTTMSAPLDAFPQSRTTRAVATTATGGSNNTGDITGNMVDSSPKTPKDGKQIPASKWIQRSRPIDDVVPVSIPPPSSSTSSSLRATSNSSYYDKFDTTPVDLCTPGGGIGSDGKTAGGVGMEESPDSVMMYRDDYAKIANIFDSSTASPNAAGVEGSSNRVNAGTDIQPSTTHSPSSSNWRRPPSIDTSGNDAPNSPLANTERSYWRDGGANPHSSNINQSRSFSPSRNSSMDMDTGMPHHYGAPHHHYPSMSSQPPRPYDRDYGRYHTKEGTHLMGAPDHPFYRQPKYHHAPPPYHHTDKNEMNAQYHTPSSSSMDPRYYNGGSASFSSSSSIYRTGSRSESSTSAKKTPRRSNESLHLGKRRDPDPNNTSSDRMDRTTASISSSSSTFVSNLPRPQAVKRDTSHQNETAETKTQVKRLNRQPSIGHRSNTSSSLGEISEHEMAILENSLEQSSLADVAPNDDDDDDNVVDPVKVENSHNAVGGTVENKVSATITINKPPMIANRVSTLELFEDGDLFPSIDTTNATASSRSDAKPNSIGDDDRQATFGSIDLASIMGGELDISSSSLQASESGARSTSTFKPEDDVKTEAV